MKSRRFMRTHQPEGPHPITSLSGCGVVQHSKISHATSLWLLRSTVRMSASHPKAAESLRSSEMTLSAKTGREQSQHAGAYSSIFVGEQLQGVGHFEIERLGRLHVDDKLELAGLYDGQVGRLRALEDLTAHCAGLTKPIRSISPVTHQPADFGIFTTGIDCGNRGAHRMYRKLHASAGEETVAADEQGVGRLAAKGCEGRLYLAASAGVEHLNLQSEGTRSFRYVAQRGLGGHSVCRIDQHGDTNCLGHQIMQESQPLCRQLSREKIHAGRVAARPRQAGDETQPDRVFPTPKTIGIVEVAALAASAAAVVPGVAMTATR